jgi:hypothetical protein
MQKTNVGLLFVLMGNLFLGCGHQTTTSAKDSSRDVFHAPEQVTDAGPATEVSQTADVDAGSEPRVPDAGAVQTESEPQLSDYPDSPDTAQCIPQYPQDDSIITDSTPMFIWESALGAQEYKFELAKDIPFGELVFVSQLLDEPLTTRYLYLPPAYALSPETTYFWRIHSVASNVSTLCTTHFSFQTE